MAKPFSYVDDYEWTMPLYWQLTMNYRRLSEECPSRIELRQTAAVMHVVDSMQANETMIVDV
jgi:hypothetical protein